MVIWYKYNTERIYTKSLILQNFFFQFTTVSNYPT